MKLKLLLFPVLLIAFIACQQNPKYNQSANTKSSISDSVLAKIKTDNDNNSIKNRQMTNTEKEVLGVVKAWNDCFTNNDNEKYFTYIHDDLTLFIPSSPYRIDGKKDDMEEFEWSLSKSKTKVHFFQELQPAVQVYDSTAIVTYYNRGAYGPDGNEQIYYLKETDVLIKENGKWKIVHIHVSKTM